MVLCSVFMAILFLLLISSCSAANSNLFREYIGAESDSVKLSDVPINPKVEVHFILAFAIDYTPDNHPSPTNGKFNVFWKTNNLGPTEIASVKAKNPNVKVAVSLGGDSVNGRNKVYFSPKSIHSWVQNAVSSLTSMIKQYNLDGIDIDYEHFRSDEKTFVECIGQLITILKKSQTIKFASIAPYEDNGPVQSHYLALWKKYGHVIDYVNFQFYAYDKLSVSQFIYHFNHQQDSSYAGSQLLASFISKGNLGLPPNDGFFEACRELKRQGKLGGIFVWCADESKAFDFKYEQESQALVLEYLCSPSFKIQHNTLIKMGFCKLLIVLFTLQALLAMVSTQATAPKSDLFREYIGAEFNDVKFSDVPINPNVEFHYILAFAIDYTTSSSSSPTDGEFNVFWDTDNLTPSQVSSIKNQHSNVKVALSLGGDSVGGGSCYFNPSSVDSWVSNAVSSLTKIIQQYNLDGIDIDYEHFHADPDTFAECIGKLITTLKNNGVISFASIAPFDDDEVQSHYMALWKSYGHTIDYVNFQFYAYDKGTTVSQFMNYFQTQSSNYGGGNILASFISDGSGGLSPENGFFTACNRLKSEGKLGGIFVWSADDSMSLGFRYEKQSQALLAVPR
ncbi:2S globulin [Cynara cardunculus var. scolymus]|uniref:2S globulin n=2 Tax=Cynara cardunculus var. scolymus TaxID=59895 RepID=A0A118K7D1_CYNCS|nr:2S globulin [Cynara cardunculus var. scolymus]